MLRYADYTVVRDTSPPRRFSRQTKPRYKRKCDFETSTFCPGKEKQDMTRTMVVGGTCQALSSPTTSMGTLSAPAASINQLLAGRKGENLVREEELQLYSSDLNNYRLRGTWTGTQSSSNNRRSCFWCDYNMISFLFYIYQERNNFQQIFMLLLTKLLPPVFHRWLKR